MHRHGHRIHSKRGAEYALDRSIWLTYRIFDNMYLHVYDALEDVGVAARPEEPVGMNRSEEIVEMSNALGCKVTHDITCPDYVIVGDEVGAESL